MKRFLLPITGLLLSAVMISCGGEEEGSGDNGKKKKKEAKKEAACSYELDNESVVVMWTGYKTEESVPVPGRFDKVSVGDLSGTNDLVKLFEQLSISVDPMSINSQDTTRDGKLRRFFFGNMSGETIEGSVASVKADGTGTLNIAMNGVENEVPFAYTLDENEFAVNVTANFEVNILNYSADTAFAELHKACEAKHRGDDPDKESVTGESVKLTVRAAVNKACE